MSGTVEQEICRMQWAGWVAVDAGLMSASDPDSYAGPAGTGTYAVAYDDWESFCGSIEGVDEGPLLMRDAGRAASGWVQGGFGGDGQYEAHYRLSGDEAVSVLVVFRDECGERDGDDTGDWPAGPGFDGAGEFEVRSGILLLGDPGYVLTPDCSSHPASVDEIRDAAFDRAVAELHGFLAFEARCGRWLVDTATDECGMCVAVLFRHADG